MPEMRTGAALRQLQQAQAGMKKARQAIRLAGDDPDAAVARPQARLGGPGPGPPAPGRRSPWPPPNEPVMTKQLAVQRYATALLVRLRRIARRDFTAHDHERSISGTKTPERGRALPHPRLIRFMPRPVPSCRLPGFRRDRWPSPTGRSTPGGELPTVAIRAAGNHPFVYRKMVIGPVGPLRPSRRRPRPGRRSRRLADRVRPLERPLADQPPVLLAPGVEPPGLAFWERGSTGPSPSGARCSGSMRSTDAYRVVHAEGDGLSGLIVDRFDDVLSVEVFSLGIYQRIGPILPLLAERLGTKHFGSTSTSGSPWPRTSRAVRSRVPGSRPA